MKENDLILKSLREGSYTAFEMLYMHYAPHVEAFALRMLKNRTEAEDLTHDIFIKIWENKERMGEVRSFKDYLFRMTKNAIFNIFEHNTVTVRHRQQLRVNDFVTDDVAAQISSRDLLMLVNLAVERMPKQRREVFRMSRYEGLSQQEIAERLEISPRTVEYHIRTAVAELRKLINVIVFFI